MASSRQRVTESRTSCEADGLERPSKRPRKLCSLGTGEVIHVLSYTALPDKVEAFELVVQGLARCAYSLEASVTDVRVCHPKCGQVVFILTFISRGALQEFVEGPQAIVESSLQGLTVETGGSPSFAATGTMMPACHTLTSLLDFLVENVKGADHSAHDVRTVTKELERWFPRQSEYAKYIKLDEKNPQKYTRNLIFGNENFDCIMMCWPPGCRSTIHDHDKSSCWVVIVEGSVMEIQYALPRLDKKFLEAEARDPATAVGHCGALKIINVANMDTGGVVGTYANNDIGIHRIENRGDKLACTLHVYAPPLRKMKIFNEAGNVHVHVAKSAHPSDCIMGPDGHSSDAENSCYSGVFDVAAWNDSLHTRVSTS